MKSLRWIMVLSVSMLLVGCASQRKLARLGTERVDVFKKDLADFLPDQTEGIFEPPTEIVTTDENGNEVILMATRVDEETGNTEVTDVLQAAVVTARFQNRAERSGKIDLEFRIKVPESMLDKDWEITLEPRMCMQGDVTGMDPVVITGSSFQNRRLRGYERYQRLVDSIVTDTLDLTWRWQLERFIERNIPELYAFRTDSAYVSEESWYGVNGVEAIRHYTNRCLRNRNQYKIDHLEEYYNAYVRSPYPENARLDTLLDGRDGPFLYDYSETVDTRPRLRKIGVVVSGDIRRRDGRLLYNIPPTDTLNFYVSSLSSFAKDIIRYKKEVVYRRKDESTSRNIIFPLGKSGLYPELGDNAREIRIIEQTLSQLLLHDTYELDSLVIRANSSPDGPFQRNLELSAQRSASVSRHFNAYMRHLRDSVVTAAGLAMDSTGRMQAAVRIDLPKIQSHATPENWEGLDVLVAQDPSFTPTDRNRYARLRKVKPEDRRDHMISQERFGPYVREQLYPRLRRVDFDFHMHRRGMVKDTVETTVPDEVYQEGLQALRDRDYHKAIDLLSPYKDYNTAVAYLAMDRNLSALQILEKEPETPAVHYMMAILKSRMGDFQGAVNEYLEACRGDRMYIARGNLDPEISVLIKRYQLHVTPEEADRL